LTNEKREIGKTGLENTTINYDQKERIIESKLIDDDREKLPS